MLSQDWVFSSSFLQFSFLCFDYCLLSYLNQITASCLEPASWLLVIVYRLWKNTLPIPHVMNAKVLSGWMTVVSICEQGTWVTLSLSSVPSDKMAKKEPGWLRLLVTTKALYLWYPCRLVINATQESGLSEEPGGRSCSLCCEALVV